MLSQIARDQGIRYFLISFTDLFGVQRSKLVPAESIDQMASDGAGFAGFAAWLDMTPADPDILAIPDPDQLIQLPWQPDVAWMPADLHTITGEPLEQAPRVVLKRVLKQAEDLGYRVKTGVECEYFLLSADGEDISDKLDRQSKPCYDQQSLMRRYEVIREICDVMLTLGWGAYQNDHEDGNGQFEMNWKYADALVTADRHAFFKYMVKAIAQKHGLRATFMPKPFAHLTGNGCHTHLSIWDSSDKENLFYDPQGELGLSQLGYQFIAGVLNSAEALCAITNPTINSYKRINAPATLSGATWSPNTVSYSGNNRTHTIRIPDAGRFECRLPDGSANPYLLPAALIAAGLDGINQKLDPGVRRDNNSYTDPLPAGEAKTLPANLLDALRCLEKSEVIGKSLGKSFTSAYLKLKYQEWQQANASITPWELDNTLDC
ncbi:glutamine synthetase [Leptolyngbya boryana NIES-2135]|jgi:glutamine synthetase type III|uniref:Glutamine synthetase n=1 Tax=Leptolyngbya boryana NIES-2135 TaxID=1973484 RepID=A0A1Z4JQ78_LEPBY|nr:MULTISPECIES: type III glutamate--ammonia ligase [Leptolyngbya]BAY58869.1 glutamine synthetase [Leptolyngbya boryana NIES-2135]MBD2370543.1 type III glutamate--ammonia ligase [Leptolyngbya sp. FACHB-161]MBD2376967.1 type III glutamate--ammonia ligase [Leptolyngbya sp. FACHB-238]MBD2401334.1 type III glutamate--ammonia ligase [Leptolyngbya sp. FACHB-239]MBD2407885.1 type III glutamate--ammonia ligase [Leptolyngbya sp. FACHB-402]